MNILDKVINFSRQMTQDFTLWVKNSWVNILDYIRPIFNLLKVFHWISSFSQGVISVLISYTLVWKLGLRLGILLLNFIISLSLITWLFPNYMYIEAVDPNIVYLVTHYDSHSPNVIWSDDQVVKIEYLQSEIAKNRQVRLSSYVISSILAVIYWHYWRGVFF
jgi:hypothetical protein